MKLTSERGRQEVRAERALFRPERETWRLRRGATLTATGARFSVWAPQATAVTVVVATGEHPLERRTDERDVFGADVVGVRAGDRYGFRVDGGEPLPDPVSRSQPDGVHALSEVVDPEGARLLALYTDLLALRREQPALRPGASVAKVQGSADWCTVYREMPAQADKLDEMRAQRTLWYAFSLCGHTQDIPVPAQASERWRLRLGTDAEGYGGSGHLVHSIAAAEPEKNDVNDAPMRLSSPYTLVEQRARSVRLPAWSAAVYVRDFSGNTP